MGGSITCTTPDAINVNAGTTDTVILRHLTISGLSGQCTNGILLGGGAVLVIEDCTIDAMAQVGIGIGSGSAQNVVIRRTTITGGTYGFRVSQGAGPAQVSAQEVTISNASSAAIYVRSGVTTIDNSVITQNNVAIENDSNSTVNVESCMLTSNTTAVLAFATATIRLSNNDIFNNGTGIGDGGGAVASNGNNKKGGNPGTGGTVGAPNGAITNQ